MNIEMVIDVSFSVPRFRFASDGIFDRFQVSVFRPQASVLPDT